MKPIEGDIYELPKINETNFRKNYLAGLLNNDSPEGRTKWMDEVAKQPGIRVEVVADDDHSKVLFWVPPILYTPKTIMGSNMGQVIENGVVNSMVRRNPNILKSAIDQFQDLMAPAPAPQEDIDQWEKILKIYGLLKTTEGKEDGNDTNVRPTSYEEEDW